MYYSCIHFTSDNGYLYYRACSREKLHSLHCVYLYSALLYLYRIVCFVSNCASLILDRLSFLVCVSSFSQFCEGYVGFETSFTMFRNVEGASFSISFSSQSLRCNNRVFNITVILCLIDEPCL